MYGSLQGAVRAEWAFSRAKDVFAQEHLPCQNPVLEEQVQKNLDRGWHLGSPHLRKLPFSPTTCLNDQV